MEAELGFLEAGVFHAAELFFKVGDFVTEAGCEFEVEVAGGITHVGGEGGDELLDFGGAIGLVGDGNQVVGGVFVGGVGELVENVGDFFAEGLGVDAVFGVVGDLFFAAAFGFVDGVLHGVRDFVGVHDDFTGDIAGGTADGLDEGGGGSEEAFFVGVEDSDEGDFRQVEAFAEQVDADENVVFAEAELAEEFDALQGVNVGVEVADFDAGVDEVVGEVFGHFLGEGGDEDAFVFSGAGADFADKVVDLAGSGFDGDFGVDEPGGADDLFDVFAAGGCEFVAAGGGGHVDGLANAFFEFFPGEGPVVEGGGEAEAEFHQVAFPGHVSFEHGTNLGDGDVGFVDDGEEVVGEIVEEGGGGAAGGSAVEVAGVVFDAGAEADLFDHFEIVFGAHAKSLGFEEFSPVFQIFEPVGKFGFDVAGGAVHTLRGGHIVGSREDADGVGLTDDVTGERVDVVEGVNFVTEEFDPDGGFFVGGDDVNGVAFHPEGAAGEPDVVAFVLDIDEEPEEMIPVDFVTGVQEDGAVQVDLGVTKPVDAGHGAHHYHVPAGEEAGGGAVAEPFHIVVDGGVFFYVGVGLSNVGFRLVVVVVADEVFDRVIGEELAEFVSELGGQGFIGRHDEGGALDLFDKPGRGGRLTGAGGPEKNDVAFAPVDALSEFGNGGGLVAGGLVVADDFEPAGGAGYVVGSVVGVNGRHSVSS